MRTVLKPLIVIFACLAAIASRDALAQTALSSFDVSPAAHHTQVKLILSADTAKPGDTIFVGVDLKMEPGWHTYWKNPGAAGMATQIKWQLPPGISAGEIEWPLPKKLPPAEVTTYGYEDEVMLIVPLTIETNFSAGQIDLKANVSWLECKEVCIPANQDVESKLNIGGETKVSADAATIESWKNKVPKPLADLIIQAWWEKPADGDTRPLIIEWSAFLKDQPATSNWRLTTEGSDFFPDTSDNFEIQPTTQNLSDRPLKVEWRKTVKKFSGDWPKEISGVIALANINLKAGSGITIQIPIADKTPTDETISAQTPPESSTGVPPVRAGETPALPLMLLYALIGGLILNIMPCVLPVIALKILGFVSEAKSSPRRVRALGGIYAVGVLMSFVALAAIVIAVKAAGQ